MDVIMPKLMQSSWLFLLSLFLITAGHCATNEVEALSATNKRQLQVGYVKNFTPFVYQETIGSQIEYRGIAADMFEMIVDAYPQFEIQPIHFDTMHDALDALSLARIDVLVAPVGMEEAHIYPIRVSHAYSLDTVVIVSPKSDLDLISLLYKIHDHSSVILQIALLSAILILIVGFFYWRVEFEYNSDFKGKGVFEGLAVSIFEIYSCFLRDLTYTPKTSIGRLITSLWVLYSVIAVTIIISILTSSILLIYQQENYKIRHAHEIIHKKVGYVDGHDLAKKSIEKYAGVPIAYSDFDAMSAALERHDISYFAADKIAINDYLVSNPSMKFNITHIRLAYGLFGFGVASNLENSPVLQMINIELNVMRHGHKTTQICQKYLMPEDIMDCF